MISPRLSAASVKDFEGRERSLPAIDTVTMRKAIRICFTSLPRLKNFCFIDIYKCIIILIDIVSHVVPSLFILLYKFMHHRYGRHGPHAWLRQRMRRYARSSVVSDLVVSPPVVPATIIYVSVPTTTERIIFIIMSDGNDHSQEEIQLQESQIRHLTTTSTIAPSYILQDTGAMQKVLPIWEKIATRDASDDIDEIKNLQEDGYFVIFDEKLFERRIKSLARRATDDYLKDPTVSLDHESLRSAYQEAYLRTFSRKKYLVQEKLTEISDEQEKQLRSILSKDRIPVQKRASGDWHARDLVLVRILQIYYPGRLGDIDIINVLSEQHAFIDRYEKFVLDSEGRNEVSWPIPGSFRPTREDSTHTDLSY